MFSDITDAYNIDLNILSDHDKGKSRKPGIGGHFRKSKI